MVAGLWVLEQMTEDRRQKTEKDCYLLFVIGYSKQIKHGASIIPASWFPGLQALSHPAFHNSTFVNLHSSFLESRQKLLGLGNDVVIRVLPEQQIQRFCGLIAVHQAIIEDLGNPEISFGH